MLVKNKVQKFQKFKIFLKPTKPLKNKRKQKSAKRQQVFTNNYELEKDFSEDLKDLKPQLKTTDENIGPVELPKETLTDLTKPIKRFSKNLISVKLTSMTKT